VQAEVREASSVASGEVAQWQVDTRWQRNPQLQGLQDSTQTEQQVWPAEVGAAGPSP
jgi:hypothetical protein